MKKIKAKETLALLISTIAMAVAATSSSMCLVFIFDEPKMPKSLYKAD